MIQLGLCFVGDSPSVMVQICTTFVLALLTAATALARTGYVQTRDGKIYEGQVRFESNAVVVVNAEREVWAEVNLTNLAGVTFLSAEGLVEEERLATASTELPTPWISEDVGNVRHAGGVKYRAGTFRVRSSGTNALSTSDAFHFVFKPVSGTTELVARVTKVQLTDPWARAGLMMRESLAADSRNLFLSVSAARGGVLQWRSRLGEETSVLLDRGMSVPCWLKMKREGNTFVALKSPNGMHWELVDKLVMAAARDLYVGMAAVSVRGNVLNESVFEQVEEGAAIRNRWFVPQVELRSGSMQMGYIERMDDTAIQFENFARKDPMSQSSVANIRFQSLPSRWASVLNAGRPGVLLTSGEFIDGECRGLADGRVVVSSVPLGLIRYDVNNEVIALVLRKRSVSTTHWFEVKTIDGSVWRAREVVMDRVGLTVREPILGLRRIPLHEVDEFRRLR